GEQEEQEYGALNGPGDHAHLGYYGPGVGPPRISCSTPSPARTLRISRTTPQKMAFTGDLAGAAGAGAAGGGRSGRAWTPEGGFAEISSSAFTNCVAVGYRSAFFFSS